MKYDIELDTFNTYGSNRRETYLTREGNLLKKALWTTDGDFPSTQKNRWNTYHHPLMQAIDLHRLQKK